MAKSFVFLEITDPDILALVRGIRTSAAGVSSETGAHITIRGPYSKPVPPRQLQRYIHLLRVAPVVIEGIGIFELPDRVVVYVKVQHEKLRQIWWKPDFPIEKYGFNPHITLYEGTDRERARRLCEFLHGERVSLLSWDYSVTSHVADHKDMFRNPAAQDMSFLGLVNRGVVRADLLTRLERSLNGPRDPNQRSWTECVDHGVNVKRPSSIRSSFRVNTPSSTSRRTPKRKEELRNPRTQKNT